MRQYVPRHVRAVDEKIAVLDADVHVRAEDQQLLGELPHCLTSAEIALERSDLLVRPVRERMRPRSSNLESLAAGKLHHAATQFDQLRAHVLGRVADGGADFDDRLVQFRFHLPRTLLCRSSPRSRDVRLQLPVTGDDWYSSSTPMVRGRRLHQIGDGVGDLEQLHL